MVFAGWSSLAVLVSRMVVDSKAVDFVRDKDWETMEHW